MTTPTDFFRWWITDERTGKRRRTKWHMTAEDAAQRFPDAVAEPSSREERGSPGNAAGIVTKSAD